MIRESQYLKGLQAARLAANLTTQQVAQQLNMSPTSITNWELLRHKVRPKLINQLAAILNVTPDDLIHDTTLQSSTTVKIAHFLPNLAAVRKHVAKLSRTTLATKIGVPISLIAHWEEQRKPCSLPELAKLTEVMKIPFTMLVRQDTQFDDSLEQGKYYYVPGLEQALRHAGLTSAQLASLLNSKAYYVLQWVLLKLKVSAATVHDIARLLGVTTKDLLRDKPETQTLLSKQALMVTQAIPAPSTAPFPSTTIAPPATQCQYEQVKAQVDALDAILRNLEQIAQTTLPQLQARLAALEQYATTQR